MRRVDHVHAVRIAAHQAGEHRGGTRLDVEFRRRPLDLDRYGGEIVVRELATASAELFGEAHLGAQFRRLPGRQARGAESLGNAAGARVEMRAATGGANEW